MALKDRGFGGVQGEQDSPWRCRIKGAFDDGQAGISVHFTERLRGDIPPRLTVNLGFCALKITQRRGLPRDDL